MKTKNYLFKKVSVTAAIWLLVLLNLIQFLGYATPARWLTPAIPNEETAIAQARTMLRAWDIPTEEYVFTAEFSWRTRIWTVSVSPAYNIYEVTHYIEFSAFSGWIGHFSIHEDYW